MWTQLQSITSGVTALRSVSLVGLAALISCTLGLVVAPEVARAQSVNDGVGIVQPNATPAAERHRAPVTGVGAVADAAVVQTPVPPTVRRDSRSHAPAQGHNSGRSKPINRTAQAHLESSRQAIGLPPVAMVCQNCEPEPPCGIYRCQNSPIIDGAAIVVER